MRGLTASLLLIPALALASPAEPYVLLGVDALSSGDGGSARRFLEAAVELDPESDDALYYLARARVASDVKAAIALLEKAVGRSRFERVDAASARLDLAALLVRVGRGQDALRIIDGLSPPEAWRVEPFRVSAAAFIELGRQEAALSAVEAGLRRHPADGALHLLRARALQAAGRPVREALDLAAMAVPADSGIAAERALALIQEGGFHLENYAPGASGDARVFARSFAASPNQAALDRFFEAGGNERLDLLVLVSAAASRDAGLRRSFDEKVGGFTGRRWVDENGDSVAEEIYEYEQGRLRSWILDADQDGVADVRFADGALEAASFRYEYDPYPFLSRAGVERNGTRWTFAVAPRRMQGPFVEGAESSSVARLRLAGNLPREGTLAAVALSVSATGRSGSRTTWSLEAGLPTGLEEDANGDGKAEHFVTWRGARPSAGRRDLDGDGLFEVTESWSLRGLERIQVDLDHDGTPEYTVDFAQGLWRWDYDQDGLPDRSGSVSQGAPDASSLWPEIIGQRGSRP